MGLTATNSGSNFELTPHGVHIARCYRLIDLGTQETEFQGQKKQQHKVMFAWELLGDDKMEDGRPYSVSKRYTVSLHEKAQMRKDLEAWRGKAFTPEEEANFDLTKICGAFCMLNIVHEVGKNGNEYANIASIMPLPKGMPKPDGINEIQVFDIDNPDMEMFNGFGEKLKATIMAAPEWGQVKSKSADPFADFESDVNF